MLVVPRHSCENNFQETHHLAAEIQRFRILKELLQKTPPDSTDSFLPLTVHNFPDLDIILTSLLRRVGLLMIPVWVYFRAPHTDERVQRLLCVGMRAASSERHKKHGDALQRSR